MNLVSRVHWNPFPSTHPKDCYAKLLAIQDGKGMLVTFGSFYADEEASAPSWHLAESGENVPAEQMEGIMWAELPVVTAGSAENWVDEVLG